MNHGISKGPGYCHTSDKGQKGEHSPQFILRHCVVHLLFIPQLEALESQADCVPGTVQILCTLACPVHPHNGGKISPAVIGTFFFTSLDSKLFSYLSDFKSCTKLTV